MTTYEQHARELSRRGPAQPATVATHVVLFGKLHKGSRCARAGYWAIECGGRAVRAQRIEYAEPLEGFDERQYPLTACQRCFPT